MILTLTLLSFVVAALALFWSRRPAPVRAMSKATGFLTLFVLPIVLTGLGTQAHLEQSKSTAFCLSCHTMEPYGKSLEVGSPDHLPAAHFQNRRIDREMACFTCHTTYTMFGDLDAKMKGLKHVWVYYVGEPPETVALYEPYKNRECLHCHEGALSFEENEAHEDFREDFESEATSCLDCHDLTHEVTEPDVATLAAKVRQWG